MFFIFLKLIFKKVIFLEKRLFRSDFKISQFSSIYWYLRIYRQTTTFLKWFQNNVIFLEMLIFTDSCTKNISFKMISKKLLYTEILIFTKNGQHFFGPVRVGVSEPTGSCMSSSMTWALLSVLIGIERDRDSFLIFLKGKF